MAKALAVPSPSTHQRRRYKLKNTGIDTDAGHSAVKKVEQLTKALMRFQLGAQGLTVMPGDGDICSVEWGHNLDPWTNSGCWMSVVDVGFVAGGFMGTFFGRYPLVTTHIASEHGHL